MSDDRVEEVKKNILSPSQWVRILYMAFYAVACWVLLFVLPVIIVCQVIIALITGRDNENLRDFGGKLSAYFHKALDYLLYVNDEKPWPFVADDSFADSFSDDDDDDDSDEDSDVKKDETFSDVSSEEDASAKNEKQSADDVLADISFTDNEDSNDQSVEITESADDDSNSNEADNDSDNDRKNPD